MRRAALAAVAIVLAPAAAPAAPADCAAPPAITAIAPDLARSAERIDSKLPLLIVAVGSSSTSGVGASRPAASYPSRLQVELRRRLPGTIIRVLNRGKGGEDSPEELARLGRDVVAPHPDLVIWQVGTNAVLRRDDLSADDRMLQQGVDLLKSDGIDIVLMDLQYAPRVLARRSYPVMERLIAQTASREKIGFFHRFAMMRYWHDGGRFGAPAIGPDGLHMTDAGYRCLADELAGSLAANWNAQSKSRHRAPTVAGLAPQMRAAAGSPPH